MNQIKSDFEDISFNPFNKSDSLFEDPNDPDSHYFEETDYDSKYFHVNEINTFLNDLTRHENLSLLHLNIRSLRSNLDDFHTLLEKNKHPFNVICLTETWLNDHEFKANSNYHLPNYEGIHYERKTNKRGIGVLMYIRNDLSYKIRNDLCTSDGDREILTTELLTKSMKNIILQKVLTNATMENKLYFVTGDFNLNCLEFHQSSDIRQFFNSIFKKGAIPLINRPTRVTTSSATLIDNIFTNCVFDTSLKKGIIKTSISDHFAIFAAIKLSNEKTKNQKIKIKKRIFSDKNKESFKQDLQKINWEELNILNCTNTLYKHFIKFFSSIYDKNFPLLETEVKLKDLRTPWMSKAMRKSSKQKQKLYIKFLKSKNPEDELIYKNYKTLFEKLRKNSKQNYYLKQKDNAKQLWQVLKEITRKIRRKISLYQLQ